MKDIESAIQDHLKQLDQQPEDITKLVLDFSCKASHVKGLDAFTGLTHLSLVGLGISSLEGFPSLPKLERLNLSDNRVAGGLEHLVSAGLTSLSRLELAGNRIRRLDDLAPLKELRALRRLDLLQCPIETLVPDYQAAVFKMLDDLQYVDNLDRQGEEHDGEDEEDDFDEDEAGGEDEVDEAGGGAAGGAAGEGEEEFDEGEGDEDYDGQAEGEEGGLPEYAALVGDAPLEDDEEEYEGEAEGEEGEEPDEDEEEEEDAAPGSGGTKRKRAEEEEEEEEEDDDDEE